MRRLTIASYAAVTIATVAALVMCLPGYSHPALLVLFASSAVWAILRIIDYRRVMAPIWAEEARVAVGPPVAQRETVWRTCECCGKTHECQESFREMVQRCADERTGAIIIE